MLFSKKSKTVNNRQFSSASKNKAYPINIAIIAPNTPLIEGLKVYFRNSDKVKILYAERNTLQGLNYWQHQEITQWPDVFVIGIWKKNINSFETVIRLKCINYHCKIIIVSGIGDDTHALYYFQAGVSGYINLGVKNVDWVKAIKTVCIKNKIYSRNMD